MSTALLNSIMKANDQRKFWNALSVKILCMHGNIYNWSYIGAQDQVLVNEARASILHTIPISEYFV